MTITVENFSNEALNNVQVTDDLTTEFGTFEAVLANVDAAGEYTVANIASAALAENTNFNGSGDQNLLVGTDTMAIGASATITFDLTFFPNYAGAPFENTAVASGVGATSGNNTTDDSVDGTDPDGIDNDDDPDESSPTVIDLPVIGVSKSAGTPTNNGNGTFTVAMTITVENFGTEALNNVQVTDDLTTEFGTFEAVLGNVDAAGEYTVANIASAALTENTNFSGSGDQNLLAGTDTLAVGATATITFDLTFFPNYAGAPFENTAVANGTGATSGQPTTDNSVDGADPDGTDNDDSPDESSPTVIDLPVIGVAKSAGTPTYNGDGTFTVAMTITVENFGTEALNNVQVTDNLTTEFGTFEAVLGNVDAAGEYTVANIASAALTENTNFNGTGDQNLLAGTDTLAVGASATITFDLTFFPNYAGAPFENMADATGTGATSGQPALDSSVDGTDPDGTDNDDSPDEISPTVIDLPVIGVSKSAGTPTNNADGTFTVAMTITVENFGTEALNGVQVTDDLTTEFGTFEAVPGNVDAAGEYTVTNLTSAALDENVNFNGSGDQNLLTGTDTLAVGATATITFDLTFFPNYAGAPFENTAVANGTGATSGQPTTDNSVDGADPDGTDNDDSPDESSPTVIDLPVIGVSKSAGTPTNNLDGTFTVAITITVENFGTEALNGVQVTDNLTAEFGTFEAVPGNVDAVGEYTVTNLASGALTENVNFNGSGDQNLLTGADTLGIGATATITFDLTFFPDFATSPFENTAVASGTGATSGQPTTDNSVDGADPDGTDNDDSPDESSPTVIALPIIGVSKSAGTPTNNLDGTYTVPMTITVENFSNEALNNVQVTDNLTTEFGTFEAVPGNVDAAGEYTVANIASAALAENTNFNGSADQNLLAGTDTLGIGVSATITFDLTFFPDFATAPFENTAVATGTGATSGAPTTDNSVDGTDPDPNGDNNPDESSPTVIPLAIIGVSKSAGTIVNNGNGTYTVPMTITVENFSTEALNNVQVVDDLTTEFGTFQAALVDVNAPGEYTVANITSGTLTENTNFNGSGDQNLLAGTDTLGIGATATITFDLTFFRNFGGAPFENTAVASGTGAVSGAPTTDDSVDGADPDPNGNDVPDESSPTVVDIPVIGVAKSAGATTDNADGTYTVSITITVENLGTEALNNLQVTDDLTTEFGTFEAVPGNVDTVGEYTITNITSAALTENTNFNGSGDQNMLAGTDALGVGVTATITFDLTFFPDFANAPFTNQAVGTGTGANSGQPTTDNSTNGANPDPNGDNDPGENAPTPISIPPIGVAKNAGTIVNNGNGTYTVPITITVENFGTEALNSVQVTDDLTTEFGTFEAVPGNVDTAGEYSVANITSAALTENTNFNGAGDQDMLAGTDTLGIGATATITFDLIFFPDITNAPFENSVEATAVGATSGANTTDTSQDGTDPDPNGDNSPNEAQPTIINVPIIGVSKSAGTPTNNLDGTFTVAMTITVENFGTEALNGVQVTDDLTTEFGTFEPVPANVDAAGEYSVSNVASAALTENVNFNGSGDQNLLTGVDTLGTGATATITFNLTFFPNFSGAPFENTAVANGTGANSGLPTTDNSVDGADPDGTDNDGSPDEGSPTVVDLPLIGVSKSAGAPTNNLDGTYTVPITITVENFGTEVLNGVQVTDNLTTEFGTFETVPGNVDAAGEYTVTNIASAALAENTNFNGSGDQNLLTGADTLGIGATATITFDLTFFPDFATSPFENTAVANGTGANSGLPTTDNSVDGADPDGTDNDGNPDESSPTVISLPVIGVAKSAGTPTNNGNGTFTVPITITVENFSNEALNNVQVTDDLTTEFGTFEAVLGNVDAAGEYSVTNVFSATLTQNANFNGSGDQNLLAGTDTLGIGASATITFDLTFFPNVGGAPFENTAVASGTGAVSGAPTTDNSVDGADPDGIDNDDNPDESSPTVIDVPVIGVSKSAGTPTNNGDGTFTVPMTITVENFGTEALTNVQVTDNLTTEFGTFEAVPGNVDAAGEYTVANIASAALTENTNFNGSGDQNLLTGADALGVGATATITFDLTFFPNVATAPFENTAVANGTGAISGTPTTDNSVDGADPDPNGNNNPDESSPTVIDVPVIGVSKSAGAPTSNDNGTFTVPITITVENFGTEALNNVQVMDNLTTEFGVFNAVLGNVDAPGEYTVANIFSAALTENTNFNGSGDQNLLAGTDTLAIGATATITFDLTFFPNYGGAPFENTAVATGTGANSGQIARDDSVDGADPDPNGNNNPDESSPTVIDVPSIGVAKEAGVTTVNGDGTFTVPITITVENLGTEALNNVQVTDSLTAEFGTFQALLVNVDAPGEYTVANIASAALTENSGFNGSTNQNLLSGTDTLGIGVTATVTFDLTFFPDFANAPFTNQAVATGTGANSGQPTTDNSTNGTDPDPNGDNNSSEKYAHAHQHPADWCRQERGHAHRPGQWTFHGSDHDHGRELRHRGAE